MIHGFTDMQLVELVVPLYFAKKRVRLFYIEYATYQIKYLEPQKRIRIEGLRGIGNELKKYS